MIHALYNFATWTAQPLLLRKLRRRGQAEPGYLHAVEERFGRYTVARPDADAAAGRPLVWIHAVSLGETRAAAILIEALRQQQPGLRLLLTHSTATGRAEGARLLMPGDVQVWQPWDTRAAVGRFLRHFRPDVGVLMETEIWPNLIHQSAASGVPLALANARLSARSLRGAQKVGALMRPTYAALAVAWAQTDSDAERLRAIGAPVAGVFGNLKFDAEPTAALLSQGRRWRAASARPVLMLASSREAEEAEFLRIIGSSSNPLAPWTEGQEKALAQMPRSIQQGANPRPSPLPQAGKGAKSPMQWLIVPRHPQRFDEVAALIASHGFSVSRRSQWNDAAPPPADVWLGDSLGEMTAWYALADVALLGGSFAPLGGQNLIEAAACGCPLVMGPHTFNFAQAAELAEAAHAARRAPDMPTAVTEACALLADPPALAAMRRAALDFAHAHRGAAARTAQAVLALLRQPDTGH